MELVREEDDEDYYTYVDYDEDDDDIFEEDIFIDEDGTIYEFFPQIHEVVVMVPKNSSDGKIKM